MMGAMARSPGPRAGVELVPATEEQLLDLAVGVSTAAATTLLRFGRGLGRVARPVAGPVALVVADVVLRPPVLAARYQPATRLDELVRRGAQGRGEILRLVSRLADVLVPELLDQLLRRVDLTSEVRTRVDLDRVVADVDLDEAARGLDIDAVAARLDLEAVVDRLDLNRIVAERVDLDHLVSTVDVDAIAARLDLDAVIDRIDLVGLAEEIIAAVDLPEIIRESTGSVASETVRGVRMQGISGDEALTRAVDRFLPGRGRRPAPGAS